MRTCATSLAALWLAACTPMTSKTSTTADAEPAPTESQVRAAVAEVEELHAFFVRWFRGELPDSDAAYGRFESALTVDFEMVVPSGALLDRSQVLAGVRGAHGQWKDTDGATIEVRNAKAQPLGGGLVHVSYEEWQRSEGAWRGRRSTALLRVVESGRIEWIHVHETWMPTAD